MRHLTKIITAVALFGAVLGTPRVPVLLWSNNELSTDLPVTLEGHTVRTADFKTSYLNSVVKQNAKQSVIVFLQDQFSTEDITKYGDVYNEKSKGNAFKNIKEVMEKHHSLYLPSVEDPTSAFQHLKKPFGDKVHHLKASEITADLDVTQFPGHLIIVKLRDVMAESDPAEMLAKNDGVVGDLMAKFENAGIPFTAMFTGIESSKATQENVYTGRHLLESSDSPNATVKNENNCTLIYLRSANLTMYKLSKTSTGRITRELSSFLVLQNSQEDPVNITIECAKYGNGSIKLVYPTKNASIPTVTISMQFLVSNKSSTWKMSHMFVTLGKSETVEMKVQNQSTPIGFSYHCETGQPYKQKNITEDWPNEIQLQLIGFQVQPIGLEKGQFGRADDCTSFFSIPILSGLVITFLFLFITAFGVDMMLTTKNMDRFDDPKGKTIQVAQEG